MNAVCPVLLLILQMGHEYDSSAPLNGILEIITLAVFALFSLFYLGEDIWWNHIAGFIIPVPAGTQIFKK